VEALSVKLARAVLLAAALAAAAAFGPSPVAGQENERARLALVIEVDGAIGPASARHLKDALGIAAERRAEVVILKMNTPGGLVSSTREIIADILASPVPVIGFVAPSGGHAASAGTYILYATHVAAMAPGTNIGAATPVELGGPLPSMPGDKDGGEGKDQKSPTPPASGDAMAAKVTNDAVAFIRSLAELRGRNADWAEKAVRVAATLSANAALQEHVIELVARDTAELLQKVNGRTVEVEGSTRVLATKELTIETVEPGWMIEFLGVITDPNVALILMLIGVYGLIFEFTSPGAVAPGVVGTICLLVALYALNLLPIDYAGLALMLLGIGLLIVEAFNPTVVIGLGGVTAFLLGAAMLLKVEAPGYQISWVVVGTAAALTLGLALLTGGYVWASRKSPPRVGAQAMRGLRAEILDWSGNEGHALAQGERWRARGAESFAPGERVEVTDVTDLTLMVRRPNTRKQSDDGERP
jgi:membrane-bound serine protease (ClpP class)